MSPKIYTRTGDGGTTGLFGGARVSKDDVRVDAYGAVDELSAHLGVARALGADELLDGLLDGLQRTLFVVGAELACSPGKEASLGLELLGPGDVEQLESAIDAMQSELPPLKNFIVPGGTRLAAALHVARTVCRRAERRVVGLGRVSKVRAEVPRFLNRLSDALFVMARYANHVGGRADVPWNGRRAES